MFFEVVREVIVSTIVRVGRDHSYIARDSHLHGNKFDTRDSRQARWIFAVIRLKLCVNVPILIAQVSPGV